MSALVDQLLTDLQSHGLKVRVDGGRLLIAPRESLTPELRDRARACKRDLIRHLSGRAQAVPDDLLAWGRGDLGGSSIANARIRLESCLPFIREFAQARWSEWLDGELPEGLAGGYTADLAAGLERVLGAWPGWQRVREELLQPRGPMIFSVLWEAYASLGDENRHRVRDAGDPTLSPPACLRFPERYGVDVTKGARRDA